MLKFIMKSLDGLDPAIAALYTKQGDQYVLTGIENTVHKAKLDEFRNNNIELSEKLKTFEGIDPAAVATLTAELDEARVKLEGAEDIDDKVQKIVEQRVEAINTKHKGEIEALTTSNQTQGRQLETFIIDGNVTKAALEGKAKDSAITDIVLRAKTVFKVEGGEPVAYDNKGNQMYGADGVSKLGMNEWVTSLVKSSPHLFQDSVTGGMQDQGNPGFQGDTSKMSATQKINAGLNQR